MRIDGVRCELYAIYILQARIQLLAKGEVVKIMENNFFCRKQQLSATACHENEFRNQLVYELSTVSVPVGSL